MLAKSEAMNHYQQYGKNTDPGEFAYLYAELPESLEDLCKLVKTQLIHPVEVKQYTDVLPEGRTREDADFYSVNDMLNELVARNPQGLTMEREPAERLVLSCRFHAMLLVSMVKSQGIPARVRVGFGGYLAPESGKHYDHWISEIWNDQEARWMSVDPDVQRIDFDEFELAWDVWQRARAGEIDPQKYGFHIWWGMDYIVGNMCHDLFANLNNEIIYWQGPNLFYKEAKELTSEETAFVDRLAHLLKCPEDNLDELMRLTVEHDLLQNIRGTPPEL
ncbi:MAG: transglutaminase domain-containing protein [Chloroflexi bacterium]|nr:transglutaminase domain-containing protein [Chloroflexota bacterium]